MELKMGQVYFVKDSFFERVNDPYLKINYENSKRPHYFAFRDIDTSLFWLVPCSSRIEKYESIIKKKNAKHQSSDTIKIVKIQDTKTALLFQDMFPITTNYIQEPYIRGGQPYHIADPEIVLALEKNAKKIVSLLRRGIRFTPTQPDIKRIEELMLADLEQKSSKTVDRPMSMKERMAAAITKAEDHNRHRMNHPQKNEPDTNIE